MVDDILLTPEEQDERAKQWLKDNGLALLLGVALGLGALFGYQAWQAKLKADAEQASALYNQILSSFQNSELAEISTQVKNLKENHPGTPYAVKASLLRARQLAVSDLEAAQDELAWASEHANEAGLRHAARLRQAKVLLALGEVDAARELAEQNTDTQYQSNYQELLGDIAVQQQNLQAARTHYQSALDTLSPEAVGYATILNLKMSRIPPEQEPAE